MADRDLAFLTIQEASRRIRARELSPVELLDAVLAQTTALESRLNIYITPTFDAARTAARTAESEIRSGAYRGPLHGIPIALKDNYYTSGVRTTAGAKILADFVPKEDAFVIGKLRAAGAIFTGKTNMHEMALGGTNENPHYGVTHNPWKRDYIPGGSSGGSAAAVAAGLCLGATGTDTAGSVRIPASYCGIVGLKPTYGRCSIGGIVPLAWSLDTAGPLTRSVADAALMLQVMAGHDPASDSSAERPVPDFSAELGQPVTGLRLGIPRGDYFSPLDPEVAAAFRSAVAVLRGLGARVEEFDLPSIAQLNAVRGIISRTEAATFNRRWLASQPDAYGADVREALEVGQFVLASDYLDAQRLRSKLVRAVRTALQDFDAVLTATECTPALPMRATTVRVDTQEMPAALAIIRLTAPWNLSGVPAITVPCGFSGGGLPIGLQLSGKPWQEARLLRVAQAYEQATPWRTRRPPL